MQRGKKIGSITYTSKYRPRPKVIQQCISEVDIWGRWKDTDISVQCIIWGKRKWEELQHRSDACYPYEHYARSQPCMFEEAEDRLYRVMLGVYIQQFEEVQAIAVLDNQGESRPSDD